MQAKLRLAVLLLCVSLAASCGSPSGASRGTVSVDGKPLEAGMIRFQAIGNETSNRASGVADGGRFTLSQKLVPGEYSVEVEGFRSTGRTITDPQKGPVPETVQLSIQNLPMKVRVPSDDSGEVKIELNTTSK